jgi:bifunctional non-homologous end joining protein LigD
MSETPPELLAAMLAEAPERPLPHNVKPMLACPGDKPFDGPGWLFEVKWDGYRAIAECHAGNVRLYSRKQLSYASRFTPVFAALKPLTREAVIDGEIVALDELGRPNFQWLQGYDREPRGQLVYCVFDLLHLDGRDLTGLPLMLRKAILQDLIAGMPGIRLSEHVEEQGIAFFNAAAEAGLEGVVAKRASSRYRQGIRSKEWIKLKSRQRQEFVIGGFTQARGSRPYFGALLLGVYKDGKLVNVGKAGSGFDDKTLAEVHAQLLPLKQARSPFTPKPKTDTPATWVEPKLVCEVAFSDWTEDWHIRFPVFVGLREDKDPVDVRRELPDTGGREGDEA